MKKKDTMFLLVAYGISVIVRFLLAEQFYEVYTFWDELLHSKMSQSLAMKGTFQFRGIGNWKNDYLYYLILAPVYLLAEGNQIMTGIHFVNALVSSLVIFPLYKLAESFSLSRKSRYFICLWGICIPEMCYSGSILQENIFYPLCITYFALFAFAEKEDKKTYRYGLLGILAGLLYDTKDTGLVVIAATFGTWFVDLLIRRDLKAKIGKSFCYLAGLTFVVVFLKLLLENCFYQPENAQYDLTRIESYKVPGGFDYIFSNIDLGVLKQMGSFFIFFVIVSGFFPFLFSLSALKFMRREQRNVIVMAALTLIAVIVSSCILEYHPNATMVRVHYRYVYWLVPVFLTGFLHTVENQKISLPVFLSIGTVSTVIHVFCTSILTGHLFDAVSAKPFSVVRNPVVFWIFKITLFVLVWIAGYWIWKQKWKMMKLVSIFMIAVLFLAGFHSTRLQYRDINQLYKKTSVSDVNDAAILNEYIPDGALALMVANETVSMATLETYYTGDYLFTMQSVYDEDEGNDFYSVIQVSRRYRVDKDRITYIISETLLDNYQEIDIGLSKYHLYSVEL